MFLKRGFSLIEVLIALCLLSLVLSLFLRLQIRNVNLIEQTFFQARALEQLNFMSNMLQLKPNNLDEWISKWQAENKKIFPQAKSQIEKQGEKYLIQIQWLSGKFHEALQVF